MWEALEVAELLIKATAHLRLDAALLAGTPTHLHNVTKKWLHLDQVFVTENTLDMIVLCEARCHDRSLNTDHVPIVTRLDIALSRIQEKAMKNFRNIDWEKFTEHLQIGLLCMEYLQTSEIR